MQYGFQIEKVGTQSPGVVTIHGFVTTSTVGTISTSDIPGGGASIAKTAGKTGRYTITLAPPVTTLDATPLTNLKFMGGWACVLGPDDAAYTTAKGLVALFRDDDISTTGAKDGTIELQFVEPQTAAADAELMDAASFYFCLHIGRSSIV